MPTPTQVDAAARLPTLLPEVLDALPDPVRLYIKLLNEQLHYIVRDRSRRAWALETTVGIAPRRPITLPYATSPLTTKGDVWGYSTLNARIPIGTNGYVLTADSAQALGLKWAAASATPTLTATYVGFGDASNLLTGSNEFTWNASIDSLVLGQPAGATAYVQAQDVGVAYGGYLTVTAATDFGGGDADGGLAAVNGGDGTGSGNGASGTTRGGHGGATGGGGTASVEAGNGGATSGDGGYASVIGGASNSGNGGDVFLIPGASLGGGVTGLVKIHGAITRFIDTLTTATATVAQTLTHIICNRAGTVTLTLPAATSGQELTVRTITANTVVSASANVVPLAGGAAGTAILAATAGKWAYLVADGSNWQVQMAN